ncbi:MAG: hypothetical protein GY730_02075, partial [bacterium]|nr:hypothetical protein [bacterium]
MNNDKDKKTADTITAGKIIMQEDTSLEDKVKILKCFDPDIEKRKLSGVQHINLFLELRKNLSVFLQEFSRVSFGRDFGFKDFELEDLFSYFLDDSRFDFKLKKDKGASILYADIHAVLRRNVINNINPLIRMPLLKRKMEYYRIFSKIFNVMVASNLLDFRDTDFNEVDDIIDIGMGHSVYLTKMRMKEGGIAAFVVKREELPVQSFFCRLLEILRWPAFKSWHFMDEKGEWEIAEYIGGTTLYDVLCKGEISHGLEVQLARHSALGDIFGRGDRHFDNYLVNDGSVFPVDISFLFWEGNEEWTGKYVAGGMYEFNCLIKYAGNENLFNSKVELFFSNYKETVFELKNKIDLIERLIISFFGDQDSDTRRKIDFVKYRLDYADKYINN